MSFSYHAKKYLVRSVINESRQILDDYPKSISFTQGTIMMSTLPLNGHYDINETLNQSRTIELVCTLSD